MPLLVNLQPAGEYLGEDYYRAGGVPAVVSQLIDAGLIHEDAGTVNGKSIGANCRGVAIEDEKVIRPFAQPLKDAAGFIVLRGNLFDSAIMKTSVISDEFRDRYLSNPDDPDAFAEWAMSISALLFADRVDEAFDLLPDLITDAGHLEPDHPVRLWLDDLVEAT